MRTAYSAVYPPSIAQSTAVMKLAFLELKNPITSPTSSGFPIRPNALRSMRLLTRPRISLFVALEAVSTNAGQTALMRIPLAPCSRAVVLYCVKSYRVWHEVFTSGGGGFNEPAFFVSPMTACFDGTYAEEYGASARSPPIEDMLTIEKSAEPLVPRVLSMAPISAC